MFASIGFVPATDAGELVDLRVEAYQFAADQVADLMHFVDALGFDAEEMVFKAIHHFDRERDELV
ncbi:hypothetical protein [Streptomyces hydrogenans]|uniref:hypothetical protein n=1 Tax=Streptomyces hydrogenans TaxID=1873719 RepID=UPI0035E19BCC